MFNFIPMAVGSCGRVLGIDFGFQRTALMDSWRMGGKNEGREPDKEAAAAARAGGNSSWTREAESLAGCVVGLGAGPGAQVTVQD